MKIAKRGCLSVVLSGCVHNCLSLRSPSAAEQTIYLSIRRTAAPHCHEPINETKQLSLSQLRCDEGIGLTAYNVHSSIRRSDGVDYLLLEIRLPTSLALVLRVLS